MTHAVSHRQSIFEPGGNCTATTTASHAAVLVDCANYYLALHEAIRKARHSIFVLGWDIDGRIKLVRDGKNDYPRFRDLIRWKAKENPDIRIFLNRWDYSLFMAQDREAFGSWRWRRSPGNVHYCLDGAVPLGASHHQKIIVIDDEVAFCGGMDIALNRWDKREHMPNNHKRIDPGAIDSQLHVFQPYHDIQMLVAGPVVEVLAHIVRGRWALACGADSIPLRVVERTGGLPRCWPESFDPQFHGVRMAVSQTLPQWEDIPRTEEVYRLYLDLIARAERFIYIENQFLSHEGFAHALARRMQQVPELRALLVSNYDPNGIMERKALWATRVKFRDILCEAGVEERVTLAHPISKVGESEGHVRIHSKLMIVDDRYLRIGSSNINNRSMYLDTECDLVIEAEDDGTRAGIRAVRDDLIREHTGEELKNIARIIENGQPPERFLNFLSHSRQHLRKIDDERYRYDRFVPLAIRVADPSKPLIPVGISMALSKTHIFRILFAVLAVAGAALMWKYTPLAQYATPEQVVPLLEQVRNTPWAVPAAMAVYTFGTLLFFPHMAMTATIVLVFTPLQAFSIAMTGSLLSGAIGWYIGRRLGLRSARALVGNSAEKISAYAKKGGLAGITLLRLLPVAPYTVVNLALGMLEVPFWIFSAGTFLGTLPGTAIASYLGHSALEVWQNPSEHNIGLLAAGVAAWLAIVAGSHLAGRWWRKRHGVAHHNAGHKSEAQA